MTWTFFSLKALCLRRAVLERSRRLPSGSATVNRVLACFYMGGCFVVSGRVNQHLHYENSSKSCLFALCLRASSFLHLCKTSLMLTCIQRCVTCAQRDEEDAMAHHWDAKVLDDKMVKDIEDAFQPSPARFLRMSELRHINRLCFLPPTVLRL
jgi:hypothetical protein